MRAMKTDLVLGTNVNTRGNKARFELKIYTRDAELTIFLLFVFSMYGFVEGLYVF